MPELVDITVIPLDEHGFCSGCRGLYPLERAVDRHGASTFVQRHPGCSSVQRPALLVIGEDWISWTLYSSPVRS